MRLGPLARIAVLTLVWAFAAGCEKPAPTMKNQPVNSKQPDTEVEIHAGKKKPVGQ